MQSLFPISCAFLLKIGFTSLTPIHSGMSCLFANTNKGTPLKFSLAITLSRIPQYLKENTCTAISIFKIISIYCLTKGFLRFIYSISIRRVNDIYYSMGLCIILKFYKYKFNNSSSSSSPCPKVIEVLLALQDPKNLN